MSWCRVVFTVRSKNSKTSHRSQMEADPMWYVYEYTAQPIIQQLLTFGLVSFKKRKKESQENRSRCFWWAEFIKSETEATSSQRPTHWTRKSALINTSDGGGVLNLKISIANSLPSPYSSKESRSTLKPNGKIQPHNMEEVPMKTNNPCTRDDAQGIKIN
jgi:hypothetical protein